MSEKFDPRSHIGEVHGIYTIVDMLDKKDKYGHWIYKAVCNECGRERFSHYGSISGPSSIATRCQHTRANGDYFPTGHVWTNKRIGKIFRSMVSRCYNSRDDSYKWYGAKGVEICEEWLKNPKSFETWALNNGYTDSLTIDRIYSDQNYCPDNCRWITMEDNSRRAGKVNWITVNELTLTGRQWSDKLGLGLLTIDKYVKSYGLQKTAEFIAAALAEPISTKHRKSRQTWLSVYGIEI